MNGQKKGKESPQNIPGHKRYHQCRLQEAFTVIRHVVRTIIEYGSTVWQNASSTGIASLERVQREALTLCLGTPSTARREAMEVDMLPRDLRFAEISIRDIAKIAAKPSDEPVRQQLTNCMNSSARIRYITLLGESTQPGGRHEKGDLGKHPYYTTRAKNHTNILEYSRFLIVKKC